MVLSSPWSSVAFPQRLSTKEVHVWAWLLDDVNKGWCEKAHLGLLDAEERKRYHRLHLERDRARFAINHANTRRILGSYMDCKPGELSFRINPFGRPELDLEEHVASLFFNLSHSRTVALLALSAETEVGIDVEDVAPIEPEIARHYFSPHELVALSSLQGDAWLRSFYLCWTRKEAIAKAEGIGLSLPLHSFDVTLLPDLPPKLLMVRPPTKFRHPWTLHEVGVPWPSVVASLATAESEVEVRCFWLQETQA